jgi:uncharacterized membrane protein
MEDHKRTNNLRYLVILLLVIGCIGFYADMRANSEMQAQFSKQTLAGGEVTTSAMTGGRARGGSFDRPPASSGSGRSTVPSRPGRGYSGGYPGGYSGGYPGGYSGGYSDYGGGYYPRRSYPRSYPQSGPVIVPVPAPYPGYVQTPGYSTPVASSGSGIGLIFLLVILGFTVLPLILNLLKLKSVDSRGFATGSSNELLNDVVTVTEVQVALLAQARTIQAELTDLTLQANPETPAGRSRMLQETVLALLRSPEYWTYARVGSQTVRSREQAAQLFEQRSIEERSKFKTETLVNMGGQIKRHSVVLPEDSDPAAYIVVTLIVGTADDKPLIGSVHSAEELQAVLQRIGSVSSEYLLVYELLWSPQDQSDSLTQEQLLTGYPNLVRIG